MKISYFNRFIVAIAILSGIVTKTSAQTITPAPPLFTDGKPSAAANPDDYDDGVSVLLDGHETPLQDVIPDTGSTYRFGIRHILFALDNDYATVRAYMSTDIKALMNDLFPSGYFNSSFSLETKIIKQPVAGYLRFSGNNADSYVHYSHDNRASLTNSIDSFQYSMLWHDPVINKDVRDTATVYIYVLQPDNGSFAACYGSSGSISLKPQPSGVNFYWYDDPAATIENGLNPRTNTGYTDLFGNLVYYVEPRITGYLFPAGRLDVACLGSMTSEAQMKWTGLHSANWDDPSNWVELIDNNGRPYERPALWSPTGCVNVIIPSSAPLYPELTGTSPTAFCKDITIKDRAMLKNPHALDYNNAYVEMKLKPSERDSIFRFPKTRDKYIGANGVEYPTGRTSPNKFITYGQTLSPADTTFNLPVNGNSHWELIQVVNPYMAYLNVSTFLEKNKDKLSTSGYLIWDGEVDNNFLAVKLAGDDRYETGMRDVFSGTTAPVSSVNPELIPPLQSFFVVKKADVPVTELKMSPNWTTTSGSTCTLRSSDTEKGVLRIKATQGNNVSYTALKYDPCASNLYNRDEDVPAIFYDRIPLTLYTLTPCREALSINVNGDLTWSPTDLGLRITKTGEIKLEFTGLETFGYDVWLVDKSKNEIIDLKKNPAYTFTATATAAVEINNRFSLMMNHTDAGFATETALPIKDEDWLASSADGHIHVKSLSGDLSGLQVYNLAGMLIYRTNEKASQYRINARGSHTYIVRVMTGNESKVKTIMLK
ncbi:MAG: hypothetical protein LBT78_09490, partial [Tannerella sp.]|nr:hypothetical protein [Tannerella sp.]